MIRAVFALVCMAGCSPAQPVPERAPYDATAPLPSASLYHLDVALVDQDGQPTTLAEHRGHPTVISMFYASCPTACPLLIGDVLALEDALPPQVRDDTRVLLVSLDPARDTPEKMSQVVADRALDTSRWTLSRAELDDVRVVAAALSVSYRALDDGEMNHSSTLTALDRDGVPVFQLEGLRQDPTALVAALSEL